MKMYKWFRGLLKASAFTTVMFIMQACYGVPNSNECQFIMSGYVVDKVTGQPLEGIELSARNLDIHNDYVTTKTDSRGYFEMVQWGSCRGTSCLYLKANDTDGNFKTFDTAVYTDSDLTSFMIKLESNQ